jgi:hypothetical protein
MTALMIHITGADTTSYEQRTSDTTVSLSRLSSMLKNNAISYITIPLLVSSKHLSTQQLLGDGIETAGAIYRQHALTTAD